MSNLGYAHFKIFFWKTWKSQGSFIFNESGNPEISVEGLNFIN